MERRGNRNPHPTSKGRHVKRRRIPTIQISEKALRRLVIAFYMVGSALAGAIVQLIVDRYGA